MMNIQNGDKVVDVVEVGVTVVSLFNILYKVYAIIKLVDESNAFFLVSAHTRKIS